MKILQRNLNRSTFVVWEMKRNLYVVCVCSHCNILTSGKIIKEMPGWVASGTHCTTNRSYWETLWWWHLGAETCSSWHLKWNMFCGVWYCVVIGVFCWFLKIRNVRKCAVWTRSDGFRMLQMADLVLRLFLRGWRRERERMKERKGEDEGEKVGGGRRERERTKERKRGWRERERKEGRKIWKKK